MVIVIKDVKRFLASFGCLERLICLDQVLTEMSKPSPAGGGVLTGGWLTKPRTAPKVLG